MILDAAPPDRFDPLERECFKRVLTGRALAVRVSRETGLTRRQTESVLRHLTWNITEGLSVGKRTTLRGFGAFHIRRAAKGVDVEFRPGGELRRRTREALG